jgi:oligopeptide transport system ATP-binding protein
METLLRVEDIKKHFPVERGIWKKEVARLKAVDGVSFSLEKQKTLSLVGESGCGKTTVARLILRLLEPTSGAIYLKGQNIFTLDKSQIFKMRRMVQMVFQDPFGSLNPRQTVGSIIGEALIIHKLAEGRRRERIGELLRLVGLREEHYWRYPHQFSGGQRQRIGIARALAAEPELIVCDEPISALDVSIQAQILNLLKDLQERLHLAFVFIAHDLAVVKYISHKVAIMYLGRIVELAETKELYNNARHPYTKALLSAIPTIGEKKRIVLKGEIPDATHPPAGCHFHTRCPRAAPECSKHEPELKEFTKNHFVCCHLC